MTIKKKSGMETIANKLTKHKSVESNNADEFENFFSKFFTEHPSANGLEREDSIYKNLIENLPVMFYAAECEPPYAPLYISSAFISLGYSLKEWYENVDLWVEILHPDDRKRILEETETARNNGEDIDYEYRVFKKDGSICWVHDRGRFTRDTSGELVCWQGVIIDITEQKRAENLLRDSEERYRQMFEGNHSIKLIIDAETWQIINANPAACKFYGYALEEFKTKKISDINISSDEKIAEAMRSIKQKTQSYFLSQHCLASGEIRNVEIFSNLLKIESRKYFYSIVCDVTERNRAEEALRKSEERYRNLFENANDLLYVHDMQGNFLSINKSGERLFGYTREESLKLNLQQVIAPESLALALEMINRKIAGEEASVYEVNCLTKEGKKVSLEINSKIVYKKGKPIAIQGVARDITERNQAQEALKLSEERFRELFENANDLIYSHDLQGNFTSFNKASEIVTGYAREEILKMNVSQIIAPQFLRRAEKLFARKLKGEETTASELDIITKDGRLLTLEFTVRFVYDNDNPIGVQGIARNITERKKVEEQLQHSALFDALTNLPNRTNFMKHLSLAVERNRREKSFCFAVLFLDLDRFKVINDSLGHAIGDKLLISIAEKLKRCVRPHDVIARLGGDEFTILLSIKEKSDAVRVAERIQKNLSSPFKLDNYEVFTSASIGIIISNEIKRTPEDFLRDADTAMYQAKGTGKARYEIFDHEMHVHNINLLQLEVDLRRAIERKEFEIFYQPIVELDTGQICEFEALIRWNHPEHGLVMPDDFVPIAEETGLIIPIGEWVLGESCRQAKQWQEQISRASEISISVNLSAKQLMHPALIAQIKTILKRTNLSSRFLKLEVTESVVMEHSDLAAEILSNLQNLGISLSTDDFGTGYSSLSYLHQFPFDRLKIDRTFVSKMDSDVKSEAIVRTILLLGQNLEIEVTTEGIETEQQLWQLRSLGCRRGQGYLFSKPVNAECAEKMLQREFLVNMNTMEMPFTFLNHAGTNDVNN